MFLWGYLKAQVFTHTLPDINSLKYAMSGDCECYAGLCTSRHGKCTWEMAAMFWLSWRTSPRRCIEDVRFFVNPFFVNPRHWLTWPCSVVFIAVYNKCVILLLKWVTLNAVLCSRQFLGQRYHHSWRTKVYHQVKQGGYLWTITDEVAQIAPGYWLILRLIHIRILSPSNVENVRWSSCLHRASVTFKHFIIQLMHQYIICRYN
jgi:hypothetical protein